MEREKVQKLAAQIALLLQEDDQKADDLAVLRASIEKINERLINIERKIDVSNVVQSSAFELPANAYSHPSQEKFENLEELADKISSEFQNEKACPYEPTGKPCDHCAMCSSRGF